jgi:uncharacterized membrane protein
VALTLRALHVLAAITWIGGMLFVALVSCLVATVEDPHAIRTILAALAESRELAGRAPPCAASRDMSHTAAIA